MKISKRILAVICSLAMMVSMVASVSAASSMNNPLSLDITDNKDNTVTVDIKTSLDEISSFTGYVNVPAALKDYIASWTWSTDIATDSLEAITQNLEYVTGSVTSGSYILASMVGAGGNNFTVPSDDILVSITITLTEGGIPDTVSEADRTLTLGGEFKKATAKKGATTINDSTGTTYYLYRADHWGATKAYTEYNHFAYDPTATGNYVVVPAAVAEEEGPAYEGYVGDDDETDVAVGATFDFVPEETTTGIKWTVETNDGVKKSHVSAIDAAGAASYKLGLVIQGLAKSAVKSISAVLQ